jgi:hypothetical protein
MTYVLLCPELSPKARHESSLTLILEDLFDLLEGLTGIGSFGLLLLFLGFLLTSILFF